MTTSFDATMVLIIIAAAIATYLTRIGGYLIVSRFERLPPRVDAALNAVPAAVLTTLVAPVALTAGPAEFVAIVIAGLVAMRYPLVVMVLAGWVSVVVLRSMLS